VEKRRGIFKDVRKEEKDNTILLVETICIAGYNLKTKGRGGRPF